MLIGGIQKLSLVDYPGHTTIALFTIGCNMRCGWCHNAELVVLEKFAPALDQNQVLEFIKSRVGLVDSVTISGGEATLQPDLIDFIKQVRAFGFLVKLDTNGTTPDILRPILDQKLIDFVAIDIKNSPAKYSETIGRKVDIKTIKQTIDMVKNSGIDYEFRTTIVKSLHTIEDFDQIGELIGENGRKAKRYALQHFRPGKTIDEKFRNDDTLSESEFEIISQKMLKYAEKVVIH